MNQEKIVILGAGLAGLSAAYHLEKSGHDFDYQIFEKEDSLGGLCRSKKINGFTFDCDGHLLHFRHQYTTRLIKELLGGNLTQHQRNSWIYTSGSYVHYPFQANLFGLPFPVAKECLLGFIQALNQRHFSSPSIDGLPFGDWIIQTFGSGIARHFMLPYNRKFWTVPLNQLTCAWIDGFIPLPSLEQLIEGTISESKTKYGYNALFWYPQEGGIEQLALALAQKINQVHASCSAVGIDLAKKEITFGNGLKVNFDKLISTIPLPELAGLITGLPEQVASNFKKLRWTSIFNLNLGVEKEDLSNRHWIYFPEEKFKFFRVGFAHNFSASAAPAGKSSIYTEVAYAPSAPLSQTNLVEQIIQDLHQTKILLPQDKILIQDINDIKYGYVIYDQNHNRAVHAIADFLNAHQIFSIGRYGRWRYMSMEDSILDGKNAVAALQGDLVRVC